MVKLENFPPAMIERGPSDGTLDLTSLSDAGSLRAQAHLMLDQMLDYSENIRDRPVWQTIPGPIRARFDGAMPSLGTGLAEVHQQFMETIVPFTAANTHPGFFGWVQGGGSQVGMLAEMLAAGLNANVGGRDQIPLDVERQVTRWMRDLFGFPEESTGIFLTGTSMANFVAVVIARDARLNDRVRRTGIRTDSAKLSAYASTAVHGSMAKALDLAGLGSDTLRMIGTDSQGRIDLELLAEAVREDRRQGFTPFLVVGSAGTVDIGAIDDLNGIAELCKQEEMWFHVDGALGALAMLAPDLAPRLKGIERADTLAFDFHKWAQVPYDAGFLLVRDGNLHQQAFASAPNYLARDDRGLSAGSPWPCDLGPELSRSFRALKVWMTFKVYGADRLGAVIQNTCDLAQALASRIREIPELELLAPVELNIVCFRYRFADTNFCDEPSQIEVETNRLNRELVLRLQEEGNVVPSTTKLQGRLAIRAAIVNHRTTRADIDALLENVLSIGQELQPRRPIIPIPAETETAWTSKAADQEELREIDILMAADTIKPATEVVLRVQRGILLARLGRSLEARSEHLRVLEIDPAHRANLLELGKLLVNTGHRKAALVVYNEAVKHHPEDYVSRVNLASTLLGEEDPDGARRHYEIALQINSDLVEAHGGMYYALTRLGEHEQAAFHQRRSFGRKNVFKMPYRGDSEPISVVLLVSSTGGNTPVEKLLDDTVFQTWIVVADFYDPMTPLPEHQLIFNGIGDVEVANDALIAAKALLAGVTQPVLNDPAAVLETSRSGNAERLARLPGVRSARTKAYPRSLLARDEAASTLERDGFTFPLLLRVPGFHMGQHFNMVETPADLAREVEVLPNVSKGSSEILVMEYLDARGDDGFARKYRAMFVDGEIYPLHLAISSNWKIHYFSADMADRPDHREEEERFLTDMPRFLGANAITGLEAIRDSLRLDYGGIDFGLGKNGEVLLFEANATMVVEQPAPAAIWDYRRAAVQRIHDAVRRMLCGAKKLPA